MNQKTNNAEETVAQLIQQHNESMASEIIKEVVQFPFAKFYSTIGYVMKCLKYWHDNNHTRLESLGQNSFGGIVKRDPLGLLEVYIEAMKVPSDQEIGETELASFIDRMKKKKVQQGVFITTSFFKKDIQVENGIVLIDGKKLSEYMVEFNAGTKVKTVYVWRDLDRSFINL